MSSSKSQKTASTPLNIRVKQKTKEFLESEAKKHGCWFRDDTPQVSKLLDMMAEGKIIIKSLYPHQENFEDNGYYSASLSFTVIDVIGVLAYVTRVLANRCKADVIRAEFSNGYVHMVLRIPIEIEPRDVVGELKELLVSDLSSVFEENSSVRNKVVNLGNNTSILLRDLIHQKGDSALIDDISFHIVIEIINRSRVGFMSEILKIISEYGLEVLSLYQDPPTTSETSTYIGLNITAEDEAWNVNNAIQRIMHKVNSLIDIRRVNIANVGTEKILTQFYTEQTAYRLKSSRNMSHLLRSVEGLESIIHSESEHESNAS